MTRRPDTSFPPRLLRTEHEAWRTQYFTELVQEIMRIAIEGEWTVGEYITCLARAGVSDHFLKQEVARLT